MTSIVNLQTTHNCLKVDYTSFTKEEGAKIACILSNIACAGHIWPAKELISEGSKYAKTSPEKQLAFYNIATQLCELELQRQDLTPESFRFLACRYYEMNKQYKAFELIRLSVHQKNVSAYDIIRAAVLAAERENIPLMLEILNLYVERDTEMDDLALAKEYTPIYRECVTNYNKELFEEYRNLERKILQKR